MQTRLCVLIQRVAYVFAFSDFKALPSANTSKVVHFGLNWTYAYRLEHLGSKYYLNFQNWLLKKTS